MRKSVIISTVIVSLAAVYFYGLPYIFSKPVAQEQVKEQNYEPKEKKPRIIVQVTKDGFRPDTLRASVGQSIQFYNSSGSSVRIKAKDSKNIFGSEVLLNGSSYYTIFAKVDHFEFYNELNPIQKGLISVVE